MRPTTRKFVGRIVAGIVAVSMIGAGVGASAYAADGGVTEMATADAAPSMAAKTDPVATAGGTQASDSHADAGVTPAALADHTVAGVSPNGTTINAFDYWLDSPKASDINDPSNWSNIGINHDQQLKFYSRQDNLPKFNTWTGTTAPRTGMVHNTLQDGYPKLRQSNALGITQDESLAYLFNGEGHDGKAAYMDTQGLLQVDDSGYYYYNANSDAASGGTFESANFATLDTSTTSKNKWTLYDTWGVRATSAVRDSQNGQFFPFNAASDVLQESGNKLTASDTTSVSSAMNHHFGLSMSSRFVQPAGGTIQQGTGKGNAMQYHFSGDDDVWVYIDDVLVGDLGGIHVASTLDINFNTGEVKVNGERSNTLKGLYEAAEKSGATKWNGDTFADNTYHTLKFFYLERGGSDSNMSLKFNLVTIPESEIYKVDQNNAAVAGAEFTLYTTDESYSESSKVKVGSGTTDTDGTLVLKDEEGKVVSFDDLHYTTEKRYSYFILEETKVPDGYRKATPTAAGETAGMHLHYVEDQSSTSGTKSGVILSVTDPSDPGSLWRTGSLALSKVTTTASTTIEDVKGHTIDPSQGLMFAVVLKRDKTKQIGETDAWKGVYGDQLHGWKYAEQSGMAGVVETIKANPSNVFALTTSGGYEVTVENLPGNIEKYYYMLPDGQKDEAEYTIAYYYADGVTDVDGITANNTVRLNFDADDPFVRQFSANFYVSNVKNELFVQKVDTDGNSLEGGEFSLYRVSDSKSGANVDCSTIQPSGTPYDTVSTVKTPGKDASLKINGTATFPSAEKKILESGTYCLVETKAPDGYLKSNVKSKVIVNDYGVFVDAGADNDGLKVLRGAGWLVRPMSSFATNDDTDNTLTWIKSAPGSITGFSADSGAPTVTSPDDAYASRVSRKANDVKGSGEVIIDASATRDVMRLKYDVGDDEGDVQPVLQFGYSPRESDGTTMFAFDRGFGIISSTQDAANTEDNDYNENADRTDLTGVRLSNIVTGSVMAQFTDVAVSTLKISNAVEGEGDNPAPDAAFGFTVQLTARANLPALASSYEYRVCTIDETASGGYRNCGNAQTMTIDGTGSGMLSLKNGQIAVFADLPETTDYTLTETTIPAQFYQLRVEAKDNNATQINKGVATGVTAKDAERHAHFVNSYGVKATVGVIKQVKGADWTAPDGKNFGFTLKRVGDDTSQSGPVFYVDANGKATAFPSDGLVASTSGEIKKDKTQDVNFADLVFTTAGTYEFTVMENTADADRVPGWSYDVTKLNDGNNGQGYKITVSVTKDNDSGKLAATVSYENDTDKPTFVNSFIAVSALPLTGGPASARDWLVGGGIFAAMAGLAMAAMHEWRRRRGLIL